MSEVPQDDDQRHLVIMEEWVGRIVREVAWQIERGIIKEVGRLFLDAKRSNFHVLTSMEDRLRTIEAALADLKARDQ